MKKIGIPILGALFASIALAQSPEPFHGTWMVTWDGAKRPQEAKLHLGKDRSTWQTLAKRRDDPCVGREAPVTMEPKSETEAVLSIKFSEALAGCSDATVKMTLTSPTTAKGRRGQADLVMTKN